MTTIQSVYDDQLGVFTNQQQQAGDIVIKESPVAVTTNYSGNVMWSLTCNIIKHNFKNTKKSNLINQILSLYDKRVNNAPKLDDANLSLVSKKYQLSKDNIISLYNVICRNAYWVSNYLTLHKHGFALYLLISRINHSCNPNCAFVFDNTDGLIVAIKNISAGDELTVGYHFMTSSLIPKPMRVNLISHLYDFKCSCYECNHISDEIVTWNNEEEMLFNVLSKAVIGSSFLKLGLIILKTRQHILKTNSTLFLILSSIYIRSFLHEGDDETSMLTCYHLAEQCIKILPQIKKSYLKFYVKLLCRTILEMPVKNKILINILLCNDREDCAVLK
jgi:hypothetical protein